MGPLPVQRRSQTRDDATGSTRGRLDLLVEIWRQLGTGLDADALSAVVDLLEAGVSTETVMDIITELQRTTTK